jgi:predicted membrane channel-forming protein YqfA (hemolysin III family)
MRIFLSLILLFVFSACYSQVSNTPVCIKTLISVQDTSKANVLILSTAIPNTSCVYKIPQNIKMEFSSNCYILPDSCSVANPLTSKKSIIPIQTNTNKK